MDTIPTSAVKVDPITSELISPDAATFKSANGIVNGDRYLTSSTTSLTLSNGAKTLTIGTGLSYSTQQDIIIANDATHHMHATVTSYDSATGVLVVDVVQHTGSGTFASWTVNVGGIAAGVIPTGGSTGQSLTKASSANYDVQWSNVATSVGQSFTGGLISVGGSPVTSSGTLALTVAGTSGGIPYFSSGSTWATSGALSANALVIGGGAGAAPSTATTGTGVLTALGVAVGTDGAFVVKGGALGTPSSGALTNCTALPATSITGYVCGSYKRSGSSQTLTSATDVALIFPTSVKTSSAFNGTTFTAPSTGYASISGLFSFTCIAVSGDGEQGSLTVRVRDTNNNTDVCYFVDSIIYFNGFATSSISNVYPLNTTIPVTSGHTYQVWVNWDNGGDSAETGLGNLAWEMKLA